MTIRLGNSDLEIFPLGLGGNTFIDVADPSGSEAVLDGFVRGGGNFIDTADTYSMWIPGHEGGESETILGGWMRKRANRQQLVIATKVGGLPARKGLAPDNVATALDDSLRRLKTDYVDLYYAHYDDPERPMAEIAAGFDALVRSGKVRYIGFSNLEPDRMEQWISAAREGGFALPVALQPEYSLVSRRNYEQRIAPVAERHRLAVVPFSVLASGFLTGKYRTEADLGQSWRSGVVADYLNEKGLEVIDVARDIATDRGVAVATVALAWALAQPTITAPLAGATSLEQLGDLLAAPSLELTSDELSRLDTVSHVFA